MLGLGFWLGFQFGYQVLNTWGRQLALATGFTERPGALAPGRRGVTPAGVVVRVDNFTPVAPADIKADTSLELPPNGQLWRLDFTVQNNAAAPTGLKEVELYDLQGRKFEIAPRFIVEWGDAFISPVPTPNYSDTINPGLSKSVTLFYVLPPDVERVIFNYGREITFLLP